MRASRTHANGFSATTNGTLINADDVRLLRDNGFVVSVSLDGGAILNDRHRRASSGVSGFDMALSSLRPLLENPGKARVAVRATVARDDLRVAERIEELAEAGFTEIGVSPLRTSPDASLVLRDDDWQRLLEEMIRASEREWRRVRSGAGFRFSNLAIALSSHHRRRPLFSRIDRRWIIEAATRKFPKRAPCGPARAVPRLLGTLSMRWRMSRRSVECRTQRV